MTDIAIDRVFIGSCTNGRIQDLRAAAAIVGGRKVSERVNAMVVPGSGLVKAQAEAEGLDKIFTAAGFEPREPGCSMRLAMYPDKLAPGERCASTSNRNFEGRQGTGAALISSRPRWRRRRLSPAASSMCVSGDRDHESRQPPRRRERDRRDVRALVGSGRAERQQGRERGGASV